MDNNYSDIDILWRAVKRKLEIDILLGKYKNDDKVPSIEELGQMYGIGRSTSKRVLNQLVDEGILNKKQGKGYFVESKPEVQEKLKKKLMEELVHGFNMYIDIACDMDIEKEKLNEIMMNMIDKAYKTSP